MKKILFITGTRADYGKMKPLMKGVEDSDSLEAYIYVSGMHLIDVLGDTYKEVLKDNYRNVYVAYSLANTRVASYDLGDVICDLTGYVKKIQPDMIVVHGDRIDALAGAVVGALNNILVAHIEGGELSGTIDELLRHAISKLAHIHLVCNQEAKDRLIQMGEIEQNIHIIGSPDIDVMLSGKLPSLERVKERYEIDYDSYGILMYHPVTTEYELLANNIHEVVDAVIASEKNYIVIYPNNDFGYQLILNEYKKFDGNNHFKIFPSIRFEFFLTLLKNAEFIIGNSSAGIRESSVYGIPDIDIGTRQNRRYSIETSRNIQHVNEDRMSIINAINCVENHRIRNSQFGDGCSSGLFLSTLLNEGTWNVNIQKYFVDFNM